MSNSPKNWIARPTLLALLAGTLLGWMIAVALQATLGSPLREAARWSQDPQEVGDSPMAGLLSPGLIREARADLEDGEYQFFPNRRTVWVVNRTNGRMATFHYRDDEQRSVDRSRVAILDLNTFPPKDTLICLSDRNMNSILWVCNVRTGDVQMWTPATDGSLQVQAERPMAIGNYLSEKR